MKHSKIESLDNEHFNVFNSNDYKVNTELILINHPEYITNYLTC